MAEDLGKIGKEMGQKAAEELMSSFKLSTMLDGFLTKTKRMASNQLKKEKAAIKKYWESDAVKAMRGFFSNIFFT